MKNLLESRKRVSVITAPDTKIIVTKALFIQYEQFLSNKNFRQYIEKTMKKKKYFQSLQLYKHK